MGCRGGGGGHLRGRRKKFAGSSASLLEATSAGESECEKYEGVVCPCPASPNAPRRMGTEASESSGSGSCKAFGDGVTKSRHFSFLAVGLPAPV